MFAAHICWTGVVPRTVSYGGAAEECLSMLCITNRPRQVKIVRNAKIFPGRHSETFSGRGGHDPEGQLDDEFEYKPYQDQNHDRRRFEKLQSGPEGLKSGRHKYKPRIRDPDAVSCASGAGSHNISGRRTQASAGGGANGAACN